MSTLSYYDVLEVSPKASAEVIRAAYKSLMQRYHPDKNPDGSPAAERAALIVQAYEVLSDPDKRLSYDRTFQPAPVAESPPAFSASAGRGRPSQRPGKPQAASQWHAWYGWLLIICITAAGWMIHLLTRNSAAPRPAVQESRLSAPADRLALNPAPDTRRSADAAIDPLSRIVPAFVTDLSIELSPAAPGSDNPHVLLIPEIALRVDADDPVRWTQKIEEQRSALIQQLLQRLGRARYEELLKADGDLYLKTLIEDTVSAGIGLDSYGPLLPAGSASPPQRPPLKALLPRLYSIR